MRQLLFDDPDHQQRLLRESVKSRSSFISSPLWAPFKKAPRETSVCKREQENERVCVRESKRARKQRQEGRGGKMRTSSSMIPITRSAYSSQEGSRPNSALFGSSWAHA